MDDLRSLLNGTDQKVACRVHEVRDVSVLVVCFFCNLLKLWKGRSDIKSDSVGAFFGQVGDLGSASSTGDDFVTTGKGFEGDVLSKTRGRSGDEPDWCGSHCCDVLDVANLR